MAVTEQVEPRKRARGIIYDILQVMVDNHQINNAQIAALTGHNEKIITHIRKSDSFRSLLAKAVEIRHGEALQTVRSAQLTSTIVALEGMRKVIESDATLPAMKVEAARVILNNHNTTEDRLAPKSAVGQQNQVNISISLDELQAARQSALAKGNEIVLEPSDASHSPAIPGMFPPQYSIQDVYTERAKLRGEGE